MELDFRHNFDRYGALNEKCVSFIITSLLTGFKAFSGERFVHRDIKPENVFVAADGVIKIGDVGLAIHLEK